MYDFFLFFEAQRSVFLFASDKIVILGFETPGKRASVLVFSGGALMRAVREAGITPAVRVRFLKPRATKWAVRRERSRRTWRKRHIISRGRGAKEAVALWANL